jgi:hypothetical protein
VASANIRTELRAKFPGVKFSVSMRSYTCISVSWTDGPTTEEVKSIVGKYELGSFDGSTDSYDYQSSNWNKTHGGVEYIWFSRDTSAVTV